MALFLEITLGNNGCFQRQQGRIQSYMNKVRAVVALLHLSVPLTSLRGFAPPSMAVQYVDSSAAHTNQAE